MDVNEEIVIANNKNGERCLCSGCPTHNEYMKSNEERLYCFGEKTMCKFEKRGCLCGSCPIKGENKLSDFYYCTK